MKKEGYYTSGQFAKKAHVTLRTIRWYDNKNLLKPSFRTENGTRLYTDGDLAKLQQILLFKYLGFSLDDIIEKFPDFIYNSVDSIDKLIEQMDALQDAYDITTSAMEEYNDVGYFSIDTLEQLLQLEPQYLSAIVDENGAIRDNISMFQALAEAKLDDMQASEDDRYM